jgi:hypothetical protein
MASVTSSFSAHVNHSVHHSAISVWTAYFSSFCCPTFKHFHSHPCMIFYNHITQTLKLPLASAIRSGSA